MMASQYVHLIIFGMIVLVFIAGAKKKHEEASAHGEKVMKRDPIPEETPALVPARRVPQKTGASPRHVFTDKAQFLVHELEGGETLLEEISHGRVVTSTVHQQEADEVIRGIIESAVPTLKEVGKRQTGTVEPQKVQARKPMAVRVQKCITGRSTIVA